MAKPERLTPVTTTTSRHHEVEAFIIVNVLEEFVIKAVHVMLVCLVQPVLVAVASSLVELNVSVVLFLVMVDLFYVIVVAQVILFFSVRFVLLHVFRVRASVFMEVLRVKVLLVVMFDLEELRDHPNHSQISTSSMVATQLLVYHLTSSIPFLMLVSLGMTIPFSFHLIDHVSSFTSSLFFHF